MNRLVALGVIVAALALTGCSAASSEAEYLDGAREASDVPYSDSELLAIGRQVCDALQAGGGALAFKDIVIENMLDGYTLGYLSAEATQHLCPDQQEAMEKLAAEFDQLGQ